MAAAEYICAQCWHSFEAESSGAEALKCPSCGAEQPRAETSTPVAEEPEVVVDAPEVQAEEPEAADSPAVPNGLVQDAVGEELEAAANGDESDPLSGVDPSRCGWRVRSGGLTYNFHGLDALENWCSSKKSLENMEVSIEDVGNWLNLQEYRRSLRKEDPLAAYRRMSGFEEEEDDEPQVTFPEEPETKKAPMEPKPVEQEAEADPVKQAGSPAPSMAPRPSKPSIRTTGEFTFKVGEAPKGESSTWTIFAGGFVVGLVFGLALWYLGLLSALEIEPMAIFG